MSILPKTTKLPKATNIHKKPSTTNSTYLINQRQNHTQANPNNHQRQCQQSCQKLLSPLVACNLRLKCNNPLPLLQDKHCAMLTYFIITSFEKFTPASNLNMKSKIEPVSILTKNCSLIIEKTKLSFSIRHYPEIWTLVKSSTRVVRCP